MFDRVISLIGEDNYLKIKNTCILVVGLGGVGGYAVESLIRSGIENIILIDYDKIDISNLNRQIITNINNIDKLKTDITKERLLTINPNCNIITHNIFLDNNTINILDNYQIDYIIDACDTVNTKKLLIDYSIDNDIKLISSMGTANKIDPTKLEIIDIRKTSYDPLAKILRKYVCDKKTNKKVMVVSSKEMPLKKQELSSLIFVPATAGLLCSNYIIKDIINI
ncbi:MAG: ThiF family adenylyltransferase [Bacilli bacterium]|nr:ThiF family adenylyltransferase [Bacilli bacterium]